MRRTGVRWIVAIAAILGGTLPLSADDGDYAAFVTGPSNEVIIRGQSPSSRLPPPQLRVAQGIAVVGDPLAPIEPCPPTMVATPQFDPYVGYATPVATTPWRTCQIGLYGEYLYLQARNADVPFAVPQNGLLLPGTAPVGPVGVADPNYSSGFRAGGFFGLGSDARIHAAYTWYSSTVDNEVGTTGLNVINPLVMFPGTFNAGFTAQQAFSHYEIDFQLIDVDYQVTGEVCETYWFGYILGARYGRLEQTFNATYPFAAPDGTTTVATTVNFEGVGPRAGIQGERCIWPNSGFRAYGRGMASFLVGQFSANYTQTNVFNGTEVNTSLNDDRIVPVLDFELGLAWMSPKQFLRLSGGYLISAWFNSITTASWIQSVQRGDYQPGADTITFDGLTARAEIRF